MASIQSTLIALALRLFRKKTASTAAGVHKRLRQVRPRQDYNPPRRLQRGCTISRSEFHGHPLFELSAQGCKPDMDILFLHGGGYIFEMTRFHWHFLADLAGRVDARFIIPIYPLAPENSWQDVFDMIIPLYRRTVTVNADRRTVLMGDSAGGGLAAAIALEAANLHLPQVDQLLLLSPWLDLSVSNRSIAAVEALDPWLGVEGAREAGRLYAAGHDLKDYRLSPIYGDLSNLPPTRIFAGTHDILGPDSISFTEIADACGCDIELTIGPDMFHVWMLFSTPEGIEARQKIAAGLPQ